MKDIAKTLQLSKPCRKGEREITELNFQTPRVRHLLAADRHPDGSVAFSLALASSLTGEPELLLGELEPEDWVSVKTFTLDTVSRFSGLNPDLLASQYLTAMGYTVTPPQPSEEETPTRD